MSNKSAVILLSGGLDSAVTLYRLLEAGRDPIVLSVAYGQRHERETKAARELYATLCMRLGKEVPWTQVTLSRAGTRYSGTSSLMDKGRKLERGRSPEEMTSGGVPSTFVPGRNAVFLSLAAGIAAEAGADEVWAGFNAVDYSGYPDCRPVFVESVQESLRLALGGSGLRVEAPLIGLSKKQIVEEGVRLGVPMGLTWSCYAGGERPCGVCDSCIIRAAGFRAAGVEDPALGA